MGKEEPMPELGGATRRGSHKLRIAATAVVFCLMFAGGCKTSDDAAAAAAQLATTASALTNYYAALHTLLADTDELYQIAAAIDPMEPYDTQTQAYVTDTAEEIQKREKLAAALTALAEEFGKLSGSTAATDASASAENLGTSLAALNIPKVAVSDTDVTLMKGAMELIVKAVQEHKEREAAEAIDKFSSALDAWFRDEEPFCNTIGKNYANVTSALAKKLIRLGQVDPSPFLNAVFAPYGLTPQLSDPTLRSKVQTVLAAQVDTRASALAAAQEKATEDMEKSLIEMASRIHLVATEKPMAIRTAPVTLNDVQKWISAVPEIGSGAGTPAAKSSLSTDTKRR
jgi:hypothetical protein